MEVNQEIISSFKKHRLIDGDANKYSYLIIKIITACLRWCGKPTYLGYFLSKINNKINNNVIICFFYVVVECDQRRSRLSWVWILLGVFIILIVLKIFKTYFVWVKFCEIWQFLTKNVVKLWCIRTHIIIDRCLVPNLNRLSGMPNKQLSHNAVHSCLQNKDTDLWITEELISPEPVRGGKYMH